MTKPDPTEAVARALRFRADWTDEAKAKAAIAAYEDAMAAASEWRDISTAPRDGTWLLVYGDGYFEDPARIGVMRWISETHVFWEQTDASTRKRRETADGYWEGADMFPTHCYPLRS